MSTAAKPAKAGTQETCISPQIGSLLPSHIVGLLDDLEAEIVEAHLAQCEPCKEKYLTVLRVWRDAREKRLKVVAEGFNPLERG